MKCPDNQVDSDDRGNVRGNHSRIPEETNVFFFKKFYAITLVLPKK